MDKRSKKDEEEYVFEELEKIEREYQIKMKTYGIPIVKVVAYYTRKLKACMVFIFFKDEKTLQQFSAQQLDFFKQTYFDFLREKNLMPQYIEVIDGFYFDSDENVQKNFHGNYFIAKL